MRARIGRATLVVAAIGGMSLVGIGTAQAAVESTVTAVRDCNGVVDVDFDITGLPANAQVRATVFSGDSAPDELAAGVADGGGSFQGSQTFETEVANLDYRVTGASADTVYDTGRLAVVNGCSTLTVNASSELGCASDPVIGIRAAGLGDRQTVSVVLDAPEANGSGLPVQDTRTSRTDGVATFYLPFDGTDRTSVGYVVTADDVQVGSGDVDIADVCAGTGTLTVTRDCASPETLTFALTVAGLEADTGHEVGYSSDGFTLTEGTSGNAVYVDDLRTDGSGAATSSTLGSEDEFQEISDGAFVVDYGVSSDRGLGVTRILGQASVAACPATPPDTGGQPVDPPVTGTDPGTGSGAGAGTGTVPVAGTPSTQAVPVAAPAGTTPRALATTGSPVSTMVILGAGLVLLGGAAAAGARFARR